VPVLKVVDVAHHQKAYVDADLSEAGL
jgi:hypothetical protein